MTLINRNLNRLNRRFGALRAFKGHNIHVTSVNAYESSRNLGEDLVGIFMFIFKKNDAHESTLFCIEEGS